MDGGATVLPPGPRRSQGQGGSRAGGTADHSGLVMDDLGLIALRYFILGAATAYLAWYVAREVRQILDDAYGRGYMAAMVSVQSNSREVD